MHKIVRMYVGGCFLLTLRRQNIWLAISSLSSVITHQLQAPWSKPSGYSEDSSLYPANFFRRNKSMLCGRHTSESLSLSSLTRSLLPFVFSFFFSIFFTFLLHLSATKYWHWIRKKYFAYGIYNVLTTVRFRFTVFWVITSPSLVGGNKHSQQLILQTVLVPSTQYLLQQKLYQIILILESSSGKQRLQTEN